MAQESPNSTQRFDGSLSNDVNDYHIKDNQWTHARNATTEFATGKLGNEPANYSCITSPYPVIGTVYMFEDQWLIFSTDDINSEVGILKEFTCEYSALPGDFNCLNLNRNNLVTGVYKKNFDCTGTVYFSDNYRNSDRALNVDNIPYVGNIITDPNGCQTFVPTLPLTLDCSKIKLNRLINVPCIHVEKGPSGGSLLNGSYYVTLAYTVNGQKVTDYFNLSNVVSIFSHENVAGALDIFISDLDDSYDEYELVVISIVNEQTSARRIGLYSTKQQRVALDIISNELISIPLQFLPVHNPLMDSSKLITELNDHMIRVAPRSKFDFNYQPLANQIQVKWISAEYPADYYRNGGTNPNDLRDENKALFIQWVYDDGDLSSSFHIPGRAPFLGEQAVVPGIYANTYQFENVNSASQTSIAISPIGDGGYQIAEGDMGYYETDELYPQNKPAVWGNLCGKKIRHHKFPERGLTTLTDLYSDVAVSPIPGPVIRIMAIKCLNIQAPIDNGGTVISNIVGYRILKGSREGNKTILAEGIINNLFPYELKDGSGKKGLYPNYPYNSLEVDPFISTTKTSTNAAGILINDVPNNFYNDGNVEDNFTFHSPDTTFRKPFLSAQELKVYGVVQGQAVLQFQEPDKHPKHKLPTNAAFFVAALTGVGYAVLKLNGKRSTKYITPHRVGTSQELIRRQGNNAYALTNFGTYTYALLGTASQTGTVILAPGGTTGSVVDTANPVGLLDTTSGAGFTGAIPSNTAALAAFLARTTALDAGTNVVEALAGALVQNTANNTVYSAAISAALANPYMEGGGREDTYEGGYGSAFGNILQLIGGTSLFLNNWGEGTNAALELLLNFSKYEQHALQQLSHCFYNVFTPNTRRVLLNNSQYLGQALQQVNATHKVNNLYRASTVFLNTNSIIPNIGLDNTKQTLQTIGGGIHNDPADTLTPKNAASYYTALKLRLRNQYGQIGDVKQIPIGCINKVSVSLLDPLANIFSSPVIFGGDTYVTRYTEKNTMFFFYEWLYGQPNGFEYNYEARRMLQYPMYWADSQTFDVADFSQGLIGSIGSGVGINPSVFPTGFRALDRSGLTGIFTVKKAYYYLFNSGVRDFYVESEVNVGYRDWETDITKRHYDNNIFNSLPDLFNAKPETIKADNFYKYDYSLSVSKSFINFASWAHVQPTYYDPIVAESCYINHPKRVIWSLPQQFEQIRDSWRIFLANNYRDYRNDILTLQSIGLTGSLMLFNSASPLQIQGIETLKTGAGTALTIGDGAFLTQASQNLTNADRPYEHGSCQDSRSVINTPAGLFWISANSAKIFTAAGGTINIVMAEMEYWFAKFLPYKILQDFPNFDLTNNPVTGVGCQSVYDNRNIVIYFCKKDYTLRKDLPVGTTVVYVSGNDFIVNGVLPVKLGDLNYFSDASWTFSYDVKGKKWLSWHDWHPDLVMPSKDTFSVIKGAGIWKHNDRCDLFCNYFGIDYPFEVEYLDDTILNVNTLRSIEYQLEVYKYDLNCYDRYLFLEANFDEMVVYNAEQVSGLLRLINTPFNDPWAINAYPIYNLASVDVLYSKVEQKYRVNQFADITDDRGEFTNAQRMIWNTEANGYIKALNPINLNYGKSPFERKKFRGYMNSVFLRKKVCGNQKFLFNFSVNKNLPSPR